MALNLPTPGANANEWGPLINAALVDLDTRVQSALSQAAANSPAAALALATSAKNTADSALTATGNNANTLAALSNQMSTKVQRLGALNRIGLHLTLPDPSAAQEGDVAILAGEV